MGIHKKLGKTLNVNSYGSSQEQHEHPNPRHRTQRNQKQPMPTHKQREDIRAWLESQDIYCARPDFLDALIHLFQSLEKGGEDDAER